MEVQEINLNNPSEAIISEDKKYRFALWRVWDKHKPLVLFIMLNPSTADGTFDDPTIRRCVNFAKSWGYGGILVGNLIAYRATDPKNLPSSLDLSIININKEYIRNLHSMAKITVLAYGTNKAARFSDQFLPFTNEDYQSLYIIDKTVNGVPKHPLYLKGDLKPKFYLHSNKR